MELPITLRRYFHLLLPNRQASKPVRQMARTIENEGFAPEFGFEQGIFRRNDVPTQLAQFFLTDPQLGVLIDTLA